MTSVAAATPASHDDVVRVLGRPMAYKWVVAIVYVSALFLDILDTTIVNVAIPVLGKELHTSNAEWVVLGYTLSLAVWIPTSGWLGDRFGTRRIFLFALAAFTVGSALCGFAQSIEQLIAFRVLQGVGGGMLTPVGMAMLFRAFPPAERAKASSVIMIPTLLAPALGPVLGGLITTYFDWRWIFLVNVPIAAVAIVFGWTYLREHKEPSARHFDPFGFVMSAASLALIVYALSEGPRAGWTSDRVITTGVLGIILAVVMVYVELKVDNPMLELRLLLNRIFRQCNLFSFFSMSSFLGMTFVLPLYLQSIRGLSPLQSGLTTFPQAFGVMASSVIAGRIYYRIGPRRLMTVSMIGAGLTVLTFVELQVDTSLWLIRAMILLRGFCMGFAFLPMQAASYATIPPAQNGRASSLFSTQRQIAISIGVAVMASILAAHMPIGAPVTDVATAMDGIQLAMGVAAALAGVGALVAWFIHDEDAAATMAARRP
ncbi:MAG TPA: DHA2 family efflux MFS transporter permease subunit [Ilumatobacteraceae bacterium]|nr:DHA2 family efflux MFS transporter permease subunit [Ilumatobacteraceae bacterium]